MSGDNVRTNGTGLIILLKTGWKLFRLGSKKNNYN